LLREDHSDIKRLVCKVELEGLFKTGKLFLDGGVVKFRSPFLKGFQEFWLRSHDFHRGVTFLEKRGKVET
jgi:hypothetical protein